MRKVIDLALAVGFAACTTLAQLSAHACSNIFINRGNYHIEGRNMDLALNIGHGDVFRFVGQENTTDVIIDADKIPTALLATWTNRYGFWGRNADHTPILVDGMNTEGLSFAIQTLSGPTKYPRYLNSDRRQVLSSYEIGNFVLGLAKNVKEALAHLNKHQIVGAAMTAKVAYGPNQNADGIYITDIPIHFVLRDREGQSAVIEFINGKMVIHPNAGNVMTNEPPYPQQL